MYEHKFRTLKQMKNESSFHKKLKVGDCFLYGRSVIDQINTKNVGDQICYYKVIGINGLNVEYQLMFDVLEKNKKMEVD